MFIAYVEMVMEWMPIDSAPKDGQRVMLWAREWHVPTCGIFDGRDWSIGYDLPPFRREPTHWAHLPAPPF